ncbi:hypothetical protein IQ37_19615 [Chryseobacterium piperi]|uniref:Uncharacterized protein n=1 Tax=Chryseobacterium piperi TaxID=558152 RepID=A0A086A1X5_9FLAO|nr:hypothetical protein [Chryseobacterium piperi]ASW73485.1 hypothetical protein CJF12_03720 [Chryseobacterium piperi]KFF10689.1 hypothetical protein IQ37_19615 [Chryseobacterium piperi]
MMVTDASHKLIPMTTFVIEYYSNEGYADLQTLNLMNNYANFLKHPLTLGMFVPVDADGNVLKEPKNYTSWNSLEHNKKKTNNISDSMGFEEYRIYQKAEQKCFFEGFTVAYNGYSVVRIVASYDESIELSFNKTDLKPQTFKDVESLTVFDEIYLSATALKTIGIHKNK